MLGSVLKAYFLTLGDSAYPDSNDTRQRSVTKFQELCKSLARTSPKPCADSLRCLIQSWSLSENSRQSPTILSQVNESGFELRSSSRSKLSPNELPFEIFTAQLDSTRNSSDSPTITFNLPCCDRRSERRRRRQTSPVYGVELLQAQLEGENLPHPRRRLEQGDLRRRRNPKTV
jgi:hypothetical protein